ncbi:MAG: peptidase [Sphingomonas sp.]|nr:peptidase [Sphingomonas sp.]
MNLAVAAPQWLALILSILLFAAAAEDSVRLRISNVTVLLVLVGAIVAAFVAGPGIRLWQNLAVFLSLLAVGTPMFAAGKLGGGDVKLLAATGLWFDFSGALGLLIAVALAGGLLALLVLVLRSISWSEDIRRRVVLLRPKGGIPYGVAIAAGALIAMGLQRL